MTEQITNLTRAEVDRIDEGARFGLDFALMIIGEVVAEGGDLLSAGGRIAGSTVRNGCLATEGYESEISELCCRDERQVTVRFEGGYPRYTAIPDDGQPLWDFVFDCAVGLGSERLTSLMGNEQVRFEVDGVRLTDWGPAAQYGGKTVTVVMIYDPTEDE